jgi:hypothetical protein
LILNQYREQVVPMALINFKVIFLFYIEPITLRKSMSWFDFKSISGAKSRKPSEMMAFSLSISGLG